MEMFRRCKRCLMITYEFLIIEGECNICRSRRDDEVDDEIPEWYSSYSDDQ